MNLAVLSDNELLVYSLHGHRFDSYSVGDVPTPGLAELIDMCTVYDIESLWCLPGSQVSRRAQLQPIVFLSATGYNVWYSRRKEAGQDGAVMGVKAWKRGTNTFRFVFPEHAYRWGLTHCFDTAELLKALVQVRFSIGVPLELSPGRTAREVIHATCNADWLKPVCDLSALERNEKGYISKPYHFKRYPDADEAQRKYLHVLDKRSMFLRATTGVELGVGSPTLLQGYECSLRFSERTPGLWVIRFSHSTNKSGDSSGPVCMWTPDVQRLKRQGFIVQFERGYVWALHHTILRPWGEKLWVARVKTDESPLAKGIIKTLYTQGLGWLAMREEKQRETHDVLYRPDWDELVKTQARLVLEMKIAQVEKATGLLPIWGNVDEVGYLSDNPDPAQAVPGFLLENSIAGYHVKYSIPVNSQLLELFRSGVKWSETHAGLLDVGRTYATQFVEGEYRYAG